MPGEERVVLHPPDDWIRRYVAIALPIVRRILAQNEETRPAATSRPHDDEQASA